MKPIKLFLGEIVLARIIPNAGCTGWLIALGPDYRTFKTPIERKAFSSRQAAVDVFKTLIPMACLEYLVEKEFVY